MLSWVPCTLKFKACSRFIGYHGRIMPSWNIHTAHVERLFADFEPSELGIGDANAFLFGNYVPDIYVGFMVPDAAFHVDYCLTHMAQPRTIPVPEIDRFWDLYMIRHRPPSPAQHALTLGAWAHLVADMVYNARFHAFIQDRDVPSGEELRRRKQADFDAFGRSLNVSSHLIIDSDLLEAARTFRPYSVLPDDVVRAADVASSIVCANAPADDGADYLLLSEAWMADTFATCDGFLKTWLKSWRTLEADGKVAMSENVRALLGFPAPDSL